MTSGGHVDGKDSVFFKGLEFDCAPMRIWPTPIVLRLFYYFFEREEGNHKSWRGRLGGLESECAWGHDVKFQNNQ